jgi:DNA-binding response OmpR family regulator
MSLILVIEDDPRIQRALRRQFVTEGYDVHVEGTGPSGLAACKSLRPDAAILDLMLPGLSGRDVCKEIKAWSSDTPVIVLSAITEVADKVLLLETGADDYMTKPFSPRELLARVQAAIRRTKKKVEGLPHGFGDVSVDFQKMEVHKGSGLIQLTSQEFKLLRFFLDNPGRAVARDELLNDVWGFNFHVTTRTVDNQILKLRQKLEPDPANPVHFRTVHGFGYKFVPQGREAASS